MQDTQGKVIAALMEQLIQTGPEGMAEAFTALFNLAMRMERDRHLGAGRYERSDARQGYANGYKPKKVDRPAGTVTVQVPKSRGCDEPFFPQSLERGRRSSRAIMLAIAEMYVQGVSTRDAAKVMKEFGLESLSSTQVSRAAALLDDELEAWRTRRLDPVKYLILDARYEKVRDGGIVRDAAILSAIGVGPDGRRRLLGVSAALSEAEVHWRDFLNDLVDAACAASNSSSATTMPACGRRAAPCCPGRHGNAASSTWPGTPFTTPRRSLSASASARTCAPSGTQGV